MDRIAPAMTVHPGRIVLLQVAPMEAPVQRVAVPLKGIAPVPRPGTFRRENENRLNDQKQDQETLQPNLAIQNSPVSVPEQDENLLVGRNSVWEALKADKPMEKLLIAQGVDETSMQGILGVASRTKVKIERIPRVRLDDIAGTDKHQGVVAYLSATEYTPLEKMIEDGFAATKEPIFILLDEVQDPHNLGAIIRTADCVGASGVIVLEHRAVGLTSTVAKVSAGALAHMPVAKVTKSRARHGNPVRKGCDHCGSRYERCILL